MIIAEKVRNACRRLFQHFHAGQIDHPEMIRLLPVESASVNQQNSFIPQKIQNELLIIRNVELLRLLDRRLEERGTWQGRLLRPGFSSVL